MNIKPYCSGNKIRSIENPIIGKPRSKIAIQIEELAINFSVIKLNRVIGKIRVINAVTRFPDKANDPIYRFIKKHNTPKHRISFKQYKKPILRVVI